MLTLLSTALSLPTYTSASKDLLAFVDDGGNMLVAADDRASDSTRAFVESCGVRLDAAGSRVVDHFSFNAGTDKDMSHASVALEQGKNRLCSHNISHPLSPPIHLYPYTSSSSSSELM